ncbi:MAG TPA: class I SAM-dependent methyltransferase [Candidatus Acidoferrum sp.]|jgi:SAM-dependent methyltransferase|nr:class I SAM-dependent methyltransferase [Candidatus Acidoferrum sp.]
MLNTVCPLCGTQHSRLVAVTPDFGRLVRCASCRLLYRDPLPAEGVRRHYDDVYRQDTVSDHIDRRRRELFRGFLAEVRPFGYRRLLDVGCGSGEFLALAREQGWTADGIEVSMRGAALARRRGLAVYETPGDLPDGYFDAVTFWNVVDFFLRPVEQMREIHRVVAPRGLVFLRTPNAIFQAAAWRLSRIVVWPPPLARLVADAHFFQPLVWSPSTLRTLLLCAGFADIRLSNSPVSYGDPYHATSRGRERVVDGVKRVVHALANGVYRGSRGRLIVGSSLSAVARKPA